MHWTSFMTDWGGWEGWGLAGFGLGMFLMIPLLIWSLVWKGKALWKAAKEGSQGWFIALLLVNTLGILDILYIYVFSKKKS